jgi:hypothetical protein
MIDIYFLKVLPTVSGVHNGFRLRKSFLLADLQGESGKMHISITEMGDNIT